MLSREDCLVAAAAADRWPIGDAEVWCGPVKGLNRHDRQDRERVLRAMRTCPDVDI